VLAERLFHAFEKNASTEWPWFEDGLSYANARLAHALLLSARAMKQPEMTDGGLQALDWLASTQTAPEGHFAPIGNAGFYRRGGDCARFDQQPVEAHTMVSACIEAYRVTSDKRWEHTACRAFEWFLGRNDLAVPLYDPIDGSCSDGLGPQGANANRGAESTLAFLLSLVEVRLLEHFVPAAVDESGENGEPLDAAENKRQDHLEVARP
jgi:hypothetical protein